MIIPFNIPYQSKNAQHYIKKAMESKRYAGNNRFTEKCIHFLEQKYGLKNIYFTSSCTTAMEMGALLAGLQHGDEVIMPSYTFSSTANSVALRGAKPIFCEISPETMNIDVKMIESLITERTKMIVPIDYAGIPCDIQSIKKLSDKYNLMIMQDAAQSFHSFHNSGKPCGAESLLTAFSFHETKNINCGEGGALIINDDSLIERANFLQEKGTDRSLVLKGVKSKYSWVDLGSSFLLSDILASILLCQFEEVDKIVKKREVITKSYIELFSQYSKKGYLKIPKIPNGSIINHHAFFVIFDTAKNQEDFLSLLKKKEIYPYIGYMPLHSSIMGQRFGYKPSDLPITQDFASRIVRMPFYYSLQGEALDYCINGVDSVLRKIYD